MQEQYHKWYTQYLSRDFEMLVFGHAGYPIILFPTSKGKYYECKDFGLIDSVSNLLEEGKFRIYCPDSIDAMSWYNYIIHPADRVKTHIAYEKVILNDVIEFAKYESGNEKVVLAGCSFGGYHAVNLALKNPTKVSHLVSMSGSFDIKPHIFGYYDEDCYYNNPQDYLPNLVDEKYIEPIKQIQIILGAGEFDLCLDENKRLSAVLDSKEIEHVLDIKQNAIHNWQCWRNMLPGYLSMLKL